MKFRIGLGYDVHPLRAGLPLILGGVRIPFTSGLEGHSDADVLIHAIMDALLGAAALGDIGRCFPADDPQYSGISSLLLLGKVAGFLSKAGYKVNNVDSVIVAQRPRLAPYLAEMGLNVARVLNTEVDHISVKATTTEQLGFSGRGEGIAAYAVSSLFSANTLP
jgi:2-C-methyl-D-erythritol 2,4-cyclodiphosphate synthase